jgi:hypothetical protein
VLVPVEGISSGDVVGSTALHKLKTAVVLFVPAMAKQLAYTPWEVTEWLPS